MFQLDICPHDVIVKFNLFVVNHAMCVRGYSQHPILLAL